MECHVIITERANHAQDYLLDCCLDGIDGVICIGGEYFVKSNLGEIEFNEFSPVIYLVLYLGICIVLLEYFNFTNFFFFILPFGEIVS